MHYMNLFRKAVLLSFLFLFIGTATAAKYADEIIARYNVQTPSVDTPVKNLSGGNIQKILLGREIGTDPNVIITAYPVRGLDINSSYMIYDILNEEKAKNTAILFIGEDLDVLLTFCDKIMVLCEGRNMGIVHTKETTKEEINTTLENTTNELNETLIPSNSTIKNIPVFFEDSVTESVMIHILLFMIPTIQKRQYRELSRIAILMKRYFP